MKKQCVVCGVDGSVVIFIDNGVEVRMCRNCSHVFSSFNQCQDYAGYFGNNEIYRESDFWWNQAHARMYQDFCNKFITGKSGRLLDVGSGLGYFVKNISKNQNWDASGYEISKSAVDYARKKQGIEQIYQGRVEDSDFPANHFDIITLWDVIEHIPDPRGMLQYLRGILKPGGILFIHTPNIEIQLPKARLKKLCRGEKANIHYLEAKDHVNIYSEKTIEKLLIGAGYLDIAFTHLHPIQGVAGSASKFKIALKNTWYYFSKILYLITFKKINIDNLFLIAKK